MRHTHPLEHRVADPNRHATAALLDKIPRGSESCAVLPLPIRTARRHAIRLIHVALLSFVGLCGVLSGCANLMTRLEAPKVTLNSLRVVTATPDGMQVSIVLDLQNPNAQAIRVDALEFDVELGGVRIASGRMTEPLAIPGGASGRASVTATTEFASWLAAMRRFVGRSSVDYEIKGTARVDGRALPFSRRGETNMNDLLGRRP